LTANTLFTNPHSSLHGDLGLAVIALETKIGITGSAVATTLVYNENLSQPIWASVATSETRANTAYGALTTAGPIVTATTGTSALVTLSCQMSNATLLDGAAMAYAVSGATTLASTDTTALMFVSATANDLVQCSVTYPVTLTAGSNVFTAQYKTITGGTGTFLNRLLIVTPAPFAGAAGTL